MNDKKEKLHWSVWASVIYLLLMNPLYWFLHWYLHLF